MTAKSSGLGSLPRFCVIRGMCLGHRSYRGFAPLRDLALISKADIFDQESNPLGTQRNLSKQHARKAYQYVSEREKAFYPELIFNIRDASYVEFIKDPTKAKSIVVSRMDGNHRLWYADGQERGMEAISRPTSFCFLLIPDLK